MDTYSGGYFAQPTNIGSFSKTRFSIIPQFNVQVGYDIVKWLNVNVGYTFLYATEVMWASNQIDRKENPTQSISLGATPGATQLIGPARPKPLFNTSSFWVQEINVGLRFQYYLMPVVSKKIVSQGWTLQNGFVLKDI